MGGVRGHNKRAETKRVIYTGYIPFKFLSISGVEICFNLLFLILILLLFIMMMFAKDFVFNRISVYLNY